MHRSNRQLYRTRRLARRYRADHPAISTTRLPASAVVSDDLGRTSRASSGVARYGLPTYIHTASPIHVKDNQAHIFAPDERLHITRPRVITDPTDARPALF